MVSELNVPRRVLTFDSAQGDSLSSSTEWLVTNGIGGYASGTVFNIPTRRYHGYLVAVLPPPLGRVMMFNQLGEYLSGEGRPTVALAGAAGSSESWEDRPGGSREKGSLCSFRLEGGVPVWTFQHKDVTLERSVIMPQGQNTVHISYRCAEAATRVELWLQPFLHCRPHDETLHEELPSPYPITINDMLVELKAPETLPVLRVMLHAEHKRFSMEPRQYARWNYSTEQERGYPSRESLWSPGTFKCNVEKGDCVTLVASTEEWETILGLSPLVAEEAERIRCARLLENAPEVSGHALGGELVLAADQFIITPLGRAQEHARAKAMGDEVRTVIAGYHWFTDWGRDTMISLEGLTLVTGRVAEAGYLLRTFAHYVKDGLIPNMFPEGQQDGLYHTADATLWFFHAMNRYFQRSGDRVTLKSLLSTFAGILDAHLKGTRFGIRVDPRDGLLTQGEAGYQLTWMDAKVDGWVVTPRRGKAVEINALWYNALCAMVGWLEEETPGDPAISRYREAAARAKESFNNRFWYARGSYLYDVVDGEDGDDSALRPNQLFSLSLDYPVLNEANWRDVFEVVRRELYTPVGLRSLSRAHPDYRPTYFGDLHARDAAYHQGTVWGWLIGPFIDAWLRVYPEDAPGARSALSGFEAHLSEACVGSISEVFDAELPYAPRGCIAQAWSVAEVLRALERTTRPSRI